MLNSELITLLQGFDGDLDVKVCDEKGNCNDIITIEGNSTNGIRNIRIIIGSQDQSNDISDEEFLNRVNAELKDGEGIDKDEALSAKKLFEEDLRNAKTLTVKELQERYQDWYYNNYNETIKVAMIELFGEAAPLATKSLSELKLLVYENGWQDEMDEDELNNPSAILSLLYRQLSKHVQTKMLSNTKELLKEINSTKEKGNSSRRIDKTLFFKTLKNHLSF